MTKKLILPSDYADWLVQLKKRIHGARQKVVLSANEEQICLYHDIGRDILERQSQQGWGAKVIYHLSLDLRAEFPDMKGFSVTNLKYMSYFAKLCPDRQIGQQTADQLPWFHLVTILTKIESPAEREWYAKQTIQETWSRTTLELQIKNKLHLRQGSAITNFKKNLQSPQSTMAQEVLKDPYHFDFLGLGDEAHEKVCNLTSN